MTTGRCIALVPGGNLIRMNILLSRDSRHRYEFLLRHPSATLSLASQSAIVDVVIKTYRDKSDFVVVRHEQWQTEVVRSLGKVSRRLG